MASGMSRSQQRHVSDEERIQLVAKAEALAESRRPYIPNHVPSSLRWKYLVLSSLLIAHGTFGILRDDVYIPGKRGSGLHFHGLAAWLVVASMVLAALNLLSVIADHYDRRNNEATYRDFAFVAQSIAWTLSILALAIRIGGQ